MCNQLHADLPQACHSLPGLVQHQSGAHSCGQETSLRVCSVLSRGAGPPPGCRRRLRTGCKRLRSALPGLLRDCWSSRSETTVSATAEQALSTQLDLLRKRQPMLSVREECGSCGRALCGGERAADQ